MFLDKNGEIRKPYAYLAGFEMFYPDGKERGEAWKATAAKYGIIGYFPTDEAPQDQYPEYEPKDDSTAEKLKKGFLHDVNHMRRSDIIIAQLEDWRGAEPDSGTAFEAGMCYGLGYPCYYFMSDSRPLIERISCHKGEDGLYRDVEGYVVENFGYPVASRLGSTMTAIFHEYPEAPKYTAMDLGIYKE